MKKFILLITAMIPMMIFAESVEIDGINYNLIKKGNIAEVTNNNNNNIKDVVIPPEITYNGEKYTVEIIEENAFMGSSMISVEIASTIKSIGWQAFHSCSDLEKVKIGSSVSKIGGNIFSHCSKLSSIVISKDNKYFDSRNDCNAVIESETNVLWFGSNNTIIPNTVSSIKSEAFANLEITSLNIPNSVKSIERWGFAWCKKLKEISIGDGTETLKMQAFEYNENLTVVLIGKGIKKIEWGAFGNCPNIEDVYIYADTPPETDESAFTDSHIEYTTLHVPAKSIELYKTDSCFSKFGNIVAISDSGETNINVSINPQKETKIYSLDGTQRKKTQKGLNIIQSQNGRVKKAYVK